MSHEVLTSLVVDRYRGLADVALDEMTGVNLLVGANNTGKTSILEALFLSCDPVNPERWIAVAQGRELAPAGEPLFQSLQGLFPRRSSHTESEIHLHYQGREIPPGRHVYAQMCRVVGVGGGESGAEDVLEVNAGIEPTLTASQNHPARQSSAFRVPSRTRASINPTTTREALPCVFLSPVAHRGESAQIGALSTLLGNRDAKRELLGLLTDFDNGVQDVFIAAPTPTRSEIRVLHAESGDTPIPSFGDGFRRVLTYALAIHQCRGGLLLVDEIETAIHFSALRKVYSWLAKASSHHDVQIVATTHSLEALDALVAALQIGGARPVPSENEFAPREASPAGLDKLAVFRLTRVGGATQCKRVDGSKLWRLRHDAGMDLR